MWLSYGRCCCSCCHGCCCCLLWLAQWESFKSVNAALNNTISLLLSKSLLLLLLPALAAAVGVVPRCHCLPQQRRSPRHRPTLPHPAVHGRADLVPTVHAALADVLPGGTETETERGSGGGRGLLHVGLLPFALVRLMMGGLQLRSNNFAGTRAQQPELLRCRCPPASG